ncbi:MAG: hypothetical protein GF320_20370, partial [Armatimonadia bacterium]|nr:hypothetical protein [Armatimonadia bacterium]
GRIMLQPVLTEDWETAPPGSYTVDHQAEQLLLRLPTGWTADDFAGSQVEVAERNDGLLIAEKLSNFVLRNVTLEHSAGPPFIMNHVWRERPREDKNWLWDHVTVADNGDSLKLDHVHLLTFDGLTLRNNRGTTRTLFSEGEVLNAHMSGCGQWWYAMKNIRWHGCEFADNPGIAMRMDHTAENLLIESCRFLRNGDQAMVFETAIGPVTIRGCEIIGNNHRNEPGSATDSAVSLASLSNFTFDDCRFVDNNLAALAIYPRERAHRANQRGADELFNSLDFGRWGVYTDAEEGRRRCLPWGWKTGAFVRNITIANCTFTATDPEDRFIVQHYYDRDSAYDRFTKHELRAWNNRYYNPANAQAFEYEADGVWRGPSPHFGDFTQWKQTSTHANFEAGSAWGETAPRDYAPAAPELALPGDDPNAVAENDVLRYEAEQLPFTATQDVLLVPHAEASGGMLHKAVIEQVGDYGDHVDYILQVPEAGDYWVTVRYLRDSGPFRYLGYAQLTINPEPASALGRIRPPSTGTAMPWWDQQGMTTDITDVPLGRVSLAEGKHVFRFEGVHRDGYASGDFDITVDAIELSREMPLQPASALVDGKPGLVYRYYSGEYDDFALIPAYEDLTPSAVGVTNVITTLCAPKRGDFGLRFDGFLDVPEDGIYTFRTFVNGGVNLYVDGARVIDCDGEHGDGERDDPWLKRGYVGLEAGWHAIRVDYLDVGMKGSSLEVTWEGPGFGECAIPSQAFSHAEDVEGIPYVVPEGVNLLPQGNFGVASYPGDWEPLHDWAFDRITLKGTGPGAYLRLVGPPQSFIASSIRVPEDTQSIEVALRYRLAGFTQGAQPWDVPIVAVDFLDERGGKLDNGGWDKLIKLTEDTDWIIRRQQWSLPDGAVTIVVTPQYKSEAGVFDIDWIQVYDPAIPPELPLDAK